MKLKKTRLSIYPKDLSIITGKNERSCRKMLDKIRRFFHKLPHQDITIREFCEYKGLDMEEVVQMLGW